MTGWVALFVAGVAACAWGWHTATTEGYTPEQATGAFFLGALCVFSSTYQIIGGNQ